jgi:hypothetical protein
MNPREAIGPEQQTDWHLDPLAHAGRLPAEAGPLKRILEDSAIRSTMDRYVEANRAAASCQAQYKNLGRWNIHLAAGAAIAGTMVLHLAAEAPGVERPWGGWIRTPLLVVQVLFFAGVAATEFLRRNRDSFGEWMRARTLAETARIELFEVACGLREIDLPIEERDGELPLLPLQLEYFLRHQLAVQVNYYRDRAREHAAAARRSVGVGAVLVFLAAIAASLVGFEGLGDMVGVLVVAGVVAPVLISAQTNLSRLNQDERNAARYAITREHLRASEAEADAVRRAAARGDRAEVARFIRSANAVISVEHKEWISQQDARDPADSESH